MTRYQQLLHVDLITRGEVPGELLTRLLCDEDSVVSFNVDDELVDVEELPDVNRDRLIEVAQWAAGEDAKRRLGLPSEWDQTRWLVRRRGVNPCGTACCIAGKIALDDGGRPSVYASDFDWEAYTEGQDTALVHFPDGTETSAEEYARKALGLTIEQGERLFSSYNKLGDILRVVGELIADDPSREVTG